MCGICGEMRFDKIKISENNKQDLLNSIRYRGPDNSDSFNYHNLFLGHSRLAIIDVSSKSNQPMIDQSLNLAIVFNGVIYNYIALRKELSKLGYVFSSDGDTEVILKAYHFFGAKCLDKLDGIFSFCIYDLLKKKLFLSRDRFGIKPLYYSINSKRIIFSSTMKSLINRSNQLINEVALNYHFSLHSVVPAPHTIFKDIHKLEQGHYLEINEDGSFSNNKYYSTNSIQINKNLKEVEIIEEIERLLISSIKKRLTVSDVPVGVLLSGGLDSSLIVAMSSKHVSKDINTYSIGFTDRESEQGNEFHYSDIIAEQFKTNHLKIVTNDDELYSSLDSVIQMMPEPLSGQDAAGFFLLAKKVSETQKVVLSGQGADELFGGYFWYNKMASNEANDINVFTNNYIDRSFSDYQMMINKKYANKDHANRLINNWFSEYQKEDMSFLDTVLRIDVSNLIVDDPVKRVDSMTMAWALETRVPFLDKDLVEFLLTIPSKMKIESNGKYFLKKISSKYLPNDIIDRKKFYFPVPPLKVLKGKFLDFVSETLLSSECYSRGIFNHNRIKELLSEPNNHYTMLEGNTLWHLALFENWMQKNV